MFVFPGNLGASRWLCPRPPALQALLREQSAQHKRSLVNEEANRSTSVLLLTLLTGLAGPILLKVNYNWIIPELSQISHS